MFSLDYSGMVSCFKIEFFSDDDDAKAAAAKCVWVLSFVSENRKKVLTKDEILSSLKTIKSTTAPSEYVIIKSRKNYSMCITVLHSFLVVWQ